MDRFIRLAGGLMAARTKPSLAEALSVWANPHDSALLLDTFRLAVLALANEQNTGLPDSTRVLQILHLRKGTELAALGADHPAMGVRRIGKDWTLDARQFDLWAQGQISVFVRKSSTVPQEAPSMQTKMNLF